MFLLQDQYIKDFSSQFLILYVTFNRHFLEKFGTVRFIETEPYTFRTKDLRSFRMFMTDLSPWVYKIRSLF